MRICYVDESGDTKDLPGAPPHGNIAPVLVVAGLVVDQRLLENLTRTFIEIKSRYFPGLMGANTTRLGRILPEIKGADLRRAMRRGAARRNRRQALGFLDALMDVLEYHDTRIFGRIWVKLIGGPCDDRSVYTFSVQEICGDFQNLLEVAGDEGIVIADSRNPRPNASVAHSILRRSSRSPATAIPGSSRCLSSGIARITRVFSSPTSWPLRSSSPWRRIATAPCMFRTSTWMRDSVIWSHGMGSA